MRSSLRVLMLAPVVSALAPALVEAQPQLRVEGTEFVLTMGAGRVLRSADLKGATLKIGGGNRALDVTITNVEEDRAAVGGRVLLHHLQVKDASGRPSDLCRPDAEGRSLGFPIPDGRGGFNLTCTSGAEGKCVRFGYRPWEEEAGGPPLKALHQACIHMVRADYGGDNRPTTRDGTIIDLYDRFGIQKSDPEAAMPFEAAWGVDGAVCVAHPRISENISLDEIARRYPRLAPRLGPEKCTEEAAMADAAALVFNRSR